MIAAALLNDVVEVTPVTIDEIRAEFGEDVTELVEWLTDVSRPSDGNRRVRKHEDLMHLAGAPPAAKIIKLADLIGNTLTISKYDPSFWKVFRREKEALLKVLKEGNVTLWRTAASQTRRR
ncbi:(p)ppGpp synthase/HD superfamily hydrolase [Pseudorhizobium tarimense]|uniref:(P)ppGpp synthase/HD superfamily hydrolase n=1 Tax=Pseudorhizobium tarimense TaxID=1079109 RepID=A0ABV2H534_9HYPH|nr:HD domain-containing protein [Pseudorhizobium tarimense]MCJ8518873.1 HD domain-containing protein [Pseudorhizobium tarimense]